MIFSVPNLITYGRIFIIPVLAVLIGMIGPENSLEYNKNCGFWAMMIFIAAGVSDLIDGYYARKYGAVSVMGKFIDPMADKLIHMTVMVMLIPLGRISAWLVVVLLFREIFISGVRAVAAGEGLVIDAAAWGKRKTAYLNVGLSGLLYYYPIFPGTRFEFSSEAVGMACVAIAFCYSIASGFVYTKSFFQVARKI